MADPRRDFQRALKRCDRIAIVETRNTITFRLRKRTANRRVIRKSK